MQRELVEHAAIHLNPAWYRRVGRAYDELGRLYHEIAEVHLPNPPDSRRPGRAAERMQLKVEVLFIRRDTGIAYVHVCFQFVTVLINRLKGFHFARYGFRAVQLPFAKHVTV